MNGPHDLGGLQCFGPIGPESEAREPVFHAPWERRAFALTLAAGGLGKWTLDASRHARERLDPVDYLSNSYYETWFAGLEKLLVETGVVTPAELASGTADGLADEATRARVPTADKIPAALKHGAPVTMDIPLEPRFRAGDTVRVRNLNPTGHTRAPRYARGKAGTVEVDHGVHIFADKNAHGAKEGQHLYGVRFAARDLWGPQAAPRDTVRVDLWDGHLDPA